MKRLGIIFLSLALFLPGKAVNRYFVEQISLSEGLSQTSVQTVLRDAKGLVWIGTKDGLNRYDESEMNTYFHEPEDSTSIPDNQILFVNQSILC